MNKNKTVAQTDNIAHATFAGIPAYYRPGTTDENALQEVLVKCAYRRPSVGFDVQSGDHWLCLGSHIGSFALYCQSKGATATCYEPLPDNFALLKKNCPQFECHQTAISNQHAPEVTFWTSRRAHDHYRGTLLDRGKGYPQVTVKNTHASALMGRKFSGIKCDIEGGENLLLDDEWLFPQADRLVMEFHLSRDNNLENLARRIGILKQHYQHVEYCPELARLVERGTGTGKTYHDRIVYCWNDLAETTSMGRAAQPIIINDPDDDDHIVRGQQAWKRLKEAGRTTWADWKLVGTALLAGRQHAIEVAKTDTGKRYSDAFHFWLQTRGFDKIHKTDRAKLLQIMDDLERFEKWLDTKTENERASWNHPSTVWRISRCKTRGIKAFFEKVEAPIPNVKDLAPSAEKFEEDDEERNWQRELAFYVRKAIGCIKVPERWLLPELPDQGQIAVVQTLKTKHSAWDLQRFHDSWPRKRKRPQRGRGRAIDLNWRPRDGTAQSASLVGLELESGRRLQACLDGMQELLRC